MEGCETVSGYGNYLKYMNLMDVMDMMEGIYDTGVNEGENSKIRPKNSVRKHKSTKIKPNIEPDSSNDESDVELNEEDSYSDDSLTVEPPKKKIDLENPYRGLKDTGNPMELMDDAEFLNAHKFSKKTIYDIMELIKVGLIKHTNRGSPVPPLIELLITLKYLTTGSVQNKTMNGVSQSTISRIITRVTKLIVLLQDQYIKFPDKLGCERNKMNFYERGKFPEVIGSVGSTHVGVRVKGMKEYNAGFINENGYHSVRVQVHRLMLEDVHRVEAYKNAIFKNKAHIEGKVVMDVGAGTGILSIFFAKAGAKKVYAIEASNIADTAIGIIKENGYEGVITVLRGKVEDIHSLDDEKVDIIVSEWMGFYLLHEGMLDSVLYARDKFLKPNGWLFPESATIYMAPCSVPEMYDAWNDVHGIKMETFARELRKEKSQRPEIQKIDYADLLSEKIAFCWIDLRETTTEEINHFTMKHLLGVNRDGRYQGMCLWFECQFPVMSNDNTEEAVILSTCPSNTLTHWKQTVIVLPEEQIVEKDQPIAWELTMKRSATNNRRYALELAMLDPAVEEHPTPCDCYMTKCIVMKKFYEDHPDAL